MSEYKSYVVTDGKDATRIIEGKTDKEMHKEIELYLEDYRADVKELSIWELGKEVRISTEFIIIDDL